MLKGINVSKLPVSYYSQPNAWMNGEILDDVLAKLNRRLSCIMLSITSDDHGQRRLPSTRTKREIYSYIFLPPNTTSHIQPLDLGIIQNFKVHYRKLLLRFVLSKIDETVDTVSQIIKSAGIPTSRSGGCLKHGNPLRKRLLWQTLSKMIIMIILMKDKGEMDLEPPPAKIKCFQDAI